MIETFAHLTPNTARNKMTRDSCTLCWANQSVHSKAGVAAVPRLKYYYNSLSRKPRNCKHIRRRRLSWWGKQWCSGPHCIGCWRMLVIAAAKWKKMGEFVQKGQGQKAGTSLEIFERFDWSLRVSKRLSYDFSQSYLEVTRFKAIIFWSHSI